MCLDPRAPTLQGLHLSLFLSLSQCCFLLCRLHPLVYYFQKESKMSPGCTGLPCSWALMAPEAAISLLPGSVLTPPPNRTWPVRTGSVLFILCPALNQSPCTRTEDALTDGCGGFSDEPDRGKCRASEELCQSNKRHSPSSAVRGWHTASEFPPFRANLSTILQCSVKSQFCTNPTVHCLIRFICFPNWVLRSLRAVPFSLDLCL